MNIVFVSVTIALGLQYLNVVHKGWVPRSKNLSTLIVALVEILFKEYVSIHLYCLKYWLKYIKYDKLLFILLIGSCS